MPRSARRQGESNVYHVMSRGVNQSLIFEDDEDRERFIAAMRERFKEDGVELYCWCLMGNHFHLLVNASLEALANAMKSLLARYAIYFNTRYGRTGHLFQDRFKTEVIDTDEYLMTVVRYIHQNPMKAGLAESCEYPWSSYGEYLSQGDLCDTVRVLDIFGGKQAFVEFHSAESNDRCLDVPVPRRRMGDSEAIAFAEREFGPGALGRVAGMPAEERNAMLRRLKQEGVSIRQAQRLTGVGKRIVERA